LCGTTLRGNQGRLGLPPEAARTAGPPEGAVAPMGQSREALLAARPLHSPEGGQELRGGRSQPLLQVVADYKRLSAVQAAGRAGHRWPSEPQYREVSTARIPSTPCSFGQKIRKDSTVRLTQRNARFQAKNAPVMASAMTTNMPTVSAHSGSGGRILYGLDDPLGAGTKTRAPIPGQIG
jgi:hypothetical protein